MKEYYYGPHEISEDWAINCTLRERLKSNNKSAFAWYIRAFVDEIKICWNFDSEFSTDTFHFVTETNLLVNKFQWLDLSELIFYAYVDKYC